MPETIHSVSLDDPWAQTMSLGNASPLVRAIRPWNALATRVVMFIASAMLLDSSDQKYCPNLSIGCELYRGREREKDITLVACVRRERKKEREGGYSYRLVTLHPLDVRALRKRRDTALDEPRDRHLCRRRVVVSRDPGDVRVREEQRVPLTCAFRKVILHDKFFFFLEEEEEGGERTERRVRAQEDDLRLAVGL